MNEPQPDRDRHDDPVAAIRRIDEICDRFEAAFRAREQPVLEDYLAEVPTDDQDHLRRHLAKLELEYRDGELAAATEADFSWQRSDREASCPGVAEEIPEKIGRFRIRELLGAGGFGHVYKAYDPKLDRTIALKVPLRAFSSRQEEERFFREARSAAQLRHSGIVPVYETGQEDGLPYIVSEYIDGQSLSERLATQGYDLREAVQLIACVADALEYAHSQGVIHRDIKPSNILIDSEGRPYLTDFGLARRVEGEETLTVSGQILGTPAYMSPEQAAGQHDEVGARSDLYCLGVVLYEMLSGHLPFRGDRLELLRSIVQDEPRSPRFWNRSVPHDLETITLKCLAKETHHRYPSASALGEDLYRWNAGEPILARPVSTAERCWRWCRRNPAVAGLVTLVAILLVSVAIVATVGYVNTSRALGQAQRAQHETSTALGKARRAQKTAEEATEGERRARAQVDQALATAQTEKANALKNLYVSQIALMDREWQSGDYARASARLYDCPSELRGWEWYYLKRICNVEPLVLRHHTNQVWSLSVSPDGKRVASAGTDGVRIADTENGELLQTFKGHLGPVSAVTFSPDGQSVVSAGEQHFLRGPRNFGDPTIRIWDADTGKELAVLRGHTGQVKDLAVSPDGQTIVSASYDKTVRLWNAQTGVERLALRPGSGPVGSVAMSPDGQRIAAAGDDRTVVWDGQSGTEVLRLTGHEGPILCVRFSRDGRRIVSCGVDQNICLWDAETGERIRIIKQAHDRSVTSVDFDTDAQKIVSVGYDGIVKLWDTGTGLKIDTFRGHRSYVTDVEFGPDGRQVFSCGDDRSVRIWDPLAGRQAVNLGGYDGLPERIKPAVALSFDGTLVAAGQRPVTVWNTITHEKVLTFDEHFTFVLGLAFGPDRQVASISHDGVMKVWDSTTGNVSISLNAHDTRAKTIAFSPTGQHIVSADKSGTVKLWDASTGKLQFVLSDLQRKKTKSPTVVTGLGFSPDGKWLVSGNLAGWVMVQQCATGRLVHRVGGKEVAILHVAVSHDGQWIAAADRDGTVFLWDANDGQELQTIAATHGRITGLAFCDDRHRVVTGGADGTVKVWDAETGDEILGLRGHTGRVFGLAVRCDHVIAVTDDKKIWMWAASSQ